MKASKFYILDNTLFWKNHECVLLNCLIKEEIDKVLKDFHGRGLRWTPLLEINCRQNPKGWVLLANLVC